MNKTRSWPVTLKVDIDPEGLKHVIEEGRLFEFVDAFSSLAAEHIKTQVVEELAKAGVGLTQVGGGLGISAAFDVDNPYYTGPRPPGPWPWQRLNSELGIEVLRQVIREEIGRMG